MSNSPPKDIIRDGNLKASIWENEGEKGVFHTATFAKTYKDRDGNLRDTSGFGRGDLLRVAELARASYSRTMELHRELTPTREETPSRKQEQTSDCAPERQADDRQSRAEAYLREQRHARSQSHDYSYER